VKTEYVGVHMTPQEKKALQEMADRDGRTVSSLIRKWIADAVKEQGK
jgi:hypothetical protein